MDFAVSFVPGWHTPILSPWGVASLLLLAAALTTAVVVAARKRKMGSAADAEAPAPR